MANMNQSEEAVQSDTRISFQAPDEFKMVLEIEIARRRTTLKDFCIRALAKELGIPFPGEEPVSEPKRKRV